MYLNEDLFLFLVLFNYFILRVNSFILLILL